MRRFLIGLILCLWPVLATAQSVELTLDQARSLARRAFLSGDTVFANELAHGLITANPDDVGALLLLAATEPLMGRAKEGREAGAKAWTLAETDTLRHEAAFYTARAAVFDRSFANAQFWLRRAYDTAQTEAQERRVAVDFQRVRAVSPWVSTLNFSVSPSSNLNGGASSPFLVIDDFAGIGVLSGTAQALSGVRADVQIGLGYRFARSDKSQTTLKFDGYHNFNTLSSEARTLAPGVPGSAFNQAVAEISVVHDRFAPVGPLPSQYSLAFGRSWFGGQALDEYARVGLARQLRLGQRSSLTLSAQTEEHWSLTTVPDSRGFEGEIALRHRFQSGATMGLSVGGVEVTSPSVNQTYTGWSLSAEYAPAKSLGPVDLAFGVGVSTKDFPTYFVGTFEAPGGRQETTVSATIEAQFTNAEVLGFHPVLTLNASQSTSNISRFTGETIGLSFGIKSAF